MLFFNRHGWLFYLFTFWISKRKFIYGKKYLSSVDIPAVEKSH